MRQRLCLSAFVALSLSGCAYFTKPMEQPVIEEKLNSVWMSRATVGTLSLTPERRVVLVNFRNSRFCAEAPTEIGMDLATVMRGQLEGKGADKAAVKAAVEAALQSQNMVLNRRTQGMQLFLANSYFACQMYMNGGIDEAQLLEMQFQTLKIVEPLISAEIGYMYKDDGGAPAPVPAPGKPESKIREEATRATQEVLKQRSGKPQEAAPRPEDPNQR
ncbi:MAG: hypothetical protein QM742_01800 [Aquabacterium sp.]